MLNNYWDPHQSDTCYQRLSFSLTAMQAHFPNSWAGRGLGCLGEKM